AFSLSRAASVTRWPALAKRAASPVPILPAPMIEMFMFVLLANDVSFAKKMAQIIGGDNPAEQKMIASTMEAILPARLPFRGFPVPLHEGVDQQAHLRGEMAAVGIEDVNVIGLGLEAPQEPEHPARADGVAGDETRYAGNA